MGIIRISIRQVLHEMENDWYLIPKWISRAYEGNNPSVSTLIGLNNPRRLLIIYNDQHKTSLTTDQYICTDTSTDDIWGETETGETIDQADDTTRSSATDDSINRFVELTVALIKEIEDNNDDRIHSVRSPKKTLIKALNQVITEVNRYLKH
jgi:hypothetical protein